MIGDGEVPPAAWGAAGVAVTQLVNWVISWQRNRQDGTLATWQQGSKERDAAFSGMVEVVRTLREDMASLRKELDEEREMRRRAEDRVRGLQDELSAIRASLSQQGIAVPAAKPAANTA